MSQAGIQSSGGSGPGDITLDGDVSFATGSTISIITGVSTDNSGSTLEFVGNGTTTLRLNVSDANRNTLVGNQSGSATLTGQSNTGFGQNTLHALTIGNQNTAIGNLGLSSISTGNDNVAIGHLSLNSTTADTGNTSVGTNSLAQINGGNQNTALGYSAGANLLTGAFNLYLGNSAGTLNAGAESSNVYLNTLGALSESNTLRIGRGTGTAFEQLSKSFVSGINGNTLGGTPLVVTIDSSTDQLGVAAFPSGGSVVVDGDTGSATGSTISLKALNGANNAGSTANFSASGSAVVFNVSDANANTLFGKNAGNTTLTSASDTGFGTSSLHSVTSGSANCAFGDVSLSSLTTGTENCSVGSGSGRQLITGSDNLYLGFFAGNANIGSETGNVYLNTQGAASESHTLRIGVSTGSTAQSLSRAFISGINGNTLPAVPLMVTIDAATDQLGVQAIPSSGSLPWTDEAVSFAANVQNGYFCTAALSVTLPASPSQGDQINIAVDTTGSVVIQANAGQTIRIGAGVSSTTGTASNIARGDSLQLIFRAANSEWFSIGTEGSWNLA